MSSLQSLDFLRLVGGPVVATNLDGVVLYWSRGAEELFGYTADEMRLRNWWDQLSASTREQIKSIFTGLMIGASFAGECVLRHKQGTSIRVHLQIAPILDERQTPHALLAICHPLAAARKGHAAVAGHDATREATFQAQKIQAIGALASGLAHDFNNILTAILSHLDLLLFAPELSVKLREHVIHAKTSATRAAELVSRLLMFSRQTRPSFVSLQLPSLFDEVFVMLRRSIDPGIEIRPLPRQHHLWPVNADANQMMQVMTNLCLNARDAMPTGGILALDLANLTIAEAEARAPRRAGDFVRLTVSDSGKGISPQVQARLFEPYFTTKEFGKGTGLGLSIANSIVTEHGGWMEVESELGKGSRFHVFLPRLREPRPEREAPRELLAADNQSLEGDETILLVDDEEMVRLVARAVLGYRGYNIVEATNGLEAVEKYAQEPGRYALVLMDLYMPKMNGWDALARLRAIDANARVILLSGGSTDEFAEKIGELGAAAVLQKPFDNIEMVRLVRRTLDGTPPARK